MTDLIHSGAAHTMLALLCAHLLADFPLQSDWMVSNKRRWRVMAIHIAIVVATAAFAIGWLHWQLLGILAFTHAAMDMLKIRVLQPGPEALLIDQGFHLIVLAGLAIAFSDTLDRGCWALLTPPLFQLLLLGFVAIGALIAAVSAGGVLIGLLLTRITTADIAVISGLPQGGRYIGWLERALTLLFVAIDQPTGVGLLLAAKSILRFGDISDTKQRERAEYIMIGTFMSFGWALIVAVAARGVAGRLLT